MHSEVDMYLTVEPIDIHVAADLRVDDVGVAQLEAGRVGERDLLIVPVGVSSQPRTHRGGLEQYRVGAASPQAHPRAQEDGVAQQIGPRQDLDAAAAEAGDVIDGRLEDPV